MSVKILDVRIDTITEEEALNKVAKFLNEDRGHTIFTPNPEMIMEAQEDSYFREILNTSSLNLCDGKGLQFSCRLLFTKQQLQKYQYFKRVAGIDFMMSICKYAQKEDFSVYLLGSGDKVVIIKAVDKLKQLYPKLNIAGYHPGSNVESFPNKKLKYISDDNEKVITDITQASPDILFVGFGHGKQEKWIHENIKYLPSVKLAMGVGGSFDIISGKLKRAPLFLRKLSLEWLWRLLQEPKRFKRIWVAVIKFPLVFIKRYIISYASK